VEDSDLLNVITLRQPHAHAMLFLGKSVVNRIVPTPLVGRLWIHAGLEPCTLDQLPCGTPTPYGALTYGVILGSVDVARCLRCSAALRLANVWATGPWCWMVENPRPLETPIPCRGRLGTWSLPRDVAKLLGVA
jgi:hypothetical protein